MLWFVFMWALLKVAQKLDTFIGKLGIEVGSVGGSLFEEIMIGKMAFGAITKGMGGKGGDGGAIASAMSAVNGGRSPIASALAGGAAVGAGGVVGRAAMGVLGKLSKGAPLGGLIMEFSSVANGVKEASASGKNIAGKIGKGTAQVLKNVGNSAFRTNSIRGKIAAMGINANPDSVLDTEKTDELKEMVKNKGTPESLVNGLHRNVGGNAGMEIMKGLMQGNSFGEVTPDFLATKDISKNMNCTAYNGGVSWSCDDGEKVMEGVMAVRGNNAATGHVANIVKNKQGALHYTANAANGRKVDCAYTSRMKTPEEKSRLDYYQSGTEKHKAQADYFKKKTTRFEVQKQTKASVNTNNKKVSDKKKLRIYKIGKPAILKEIFTKIKNELIIDLLFFFMEL